MDSRRFPCLVTEVIYLWNSEKKILDKGIYLTWRHGDILFINSFIHALSVASYSVCDIFFFLDLIVSPFVYVSFGVLLPAGISESCPQLPSDHHTKLFIWRTIFVNYCAHNSRIIRAHLTTSPIILYLIFCSGWQYCVRKTINGSKCRTLEYAQDGNFA